MSRDEGVKALKLVEITLGRDYDCGEKRLRNTAWIDPRKVVAIKAEIMGRTRSVILLEGGHQIMVFGSPEEVALTLSEGDGE